MRSFLIGLVGAAVALSGCGSGTAPAARESAAGARPAEVYAVTARGELLTVPLPADGKAPGRAVRLGPQRDPQPGVAVRVHAVQVSADGRWVAWAESSVSYTGSPPTLDQFGFSSTGAQEITTAFLLDRRSGKTTEIPALGEPFAFAGDGLVLHNRIDDIYTVVTPGQPNRDLRDWPESEYRAVGAVSEGVITIGGSDTDDGSLGDYLVDLVEYGDGEVRTLHALPHIVTGAAGYGQGWVSDDGQRIAIERGDHTDYCGIGPSSSLVLLDREGSALGPEVPGPPIPAALPPSPWDGMRLQYVRFTDPDSALALWTMCRQSTNGTAARDPYSAVYRLQGGKWSLVREATIAVAAVPAGGIVLQPGAFRLGDGEGGPSVLPEPSGEALLIRDGRTVRLPVSGVDFHVAR